MPERIFNFAAGPATLPYSVLEQAAKDIVNFNDKGIGLTAEDFADIDHKRAKPPTVDAAMCQRMGMFVVGRLSARHDCRVQQRPSVEKAGTHSLF